MRRAPLTARQRELLDFIETYVRDTGEAPTYEVMAAAIGVSGKSNIHRMVKCLEERDAIRRRIGQHGFDVVLQAFGARAVFIPFGPQTGEGPPRATPHFVWPFHSHRSMAQVMAAERDIAA